MAVYTWLRPCFLIAHRWHAPHLLVIMPIFIFVLPRFPSVLSSKHQTFGHLYILLRAQIINALRRWNVLYRILRLLQILIIHKWLFCGLWYRPSRQILNIFLLNLQGLEVSVWCKTPFLIVKVKWSLICMSLIELERVLIISDLVLCQKMVETVGVIGVQLWIYMWGPGDWLDLVLWNSL